MDRRSPKLTLSVCGLALALLAPNTGCRSLRSEVPPGKPFKGDGAQQPPIGFSNQPHQPGGMSALSGGAPGGVGPGVGQLGTPAPSAGNYGVPSTHAFGAPGTSGTAPGADMTPAGAGSSSSGSLPAPTQNPFN